MESLNYSASEQVDPSQFENFEKPYYQRRI